MAGVADGSDERPGADMGDESSEREEDDINEEDFDEQALQEAFERQVSDRRRQFRGPEKAYEIPTELYEKAEKHNDRLTQEERAFLLSRGDVVGKALAHPDSLTQEERYAVLQWSPPEVLHAAIRRATGDVLSTPEELYAAASTALSGSGANGISPEAKRIVASRFWVDAASEFHFSKMYWNNTPGNWQATQLLYGRADMDIMFLVSRPFTSSLPQPAVVASQPASSAQQPSEGSASGAQSFHSNLLPGEPTVSGLSATSTSLPSGTSHLPQDLHYDTEDGAPPPTKRTRASFDPATGHGAWPLSYPPELTDGLSLFRHETYLNTREDNTNPFDDRTVLQRWEALGESQRAKYMARTETMRGQAWDLHEKTDDALLTGEGAASLPARVDLPGLEVFTTRWERETEVHASTIHDKMSKNTNNKRPRQPSAPGPPSRNTPSYDGQPAWPMHVNAGPFRPFGLFWETQRAGLRPGEDLAAVWGTNDVGREAQRLFDALNGQERAVYEATSERLRQDVWNEWEEYERRQAAGEVVMRPAHRQRP